MLQIYPAKYLNEVNWWFNKKQSGNFFSDFIRIQVTTLSEYTAGLVVWSSANTFSSWGFYFLW